MSRIPFWASDARLTSLWVAVMAVVVTSCFTEDQRTEVPDLLISPSSAKQGDLLALKLTAEGINFDECGSITFESFTFDTSLISIHAVDVLDGNTVRAHIEIDDSADVDTYFPVLRCNPMTGLKGTFSVKLRSEELILTADPPSSAAGPNKPLTLSVDADFFEEDSTYVVFGGGEYISVNNQAVITSRRLDLVLNIPIDTPVKELEIVAVTGSRTARGTFAVTERIEPTIQVTPNEIKRPAIDTGQTAQYTLEIKGTDVDFVAPTEDAGLGDPNASKVDFLLYGEDDTHAPGIEVTKVDVKDAENISTNILLENSANIGQTRLRVTTGDQELETSVTIVPSDGDPSLRFSPTTVARGCRNRPVLITATNFMFKKPLSISCVEETGCSVQYSIIGTPSKQLILAVTIDADFSGDYATLEIRSDGETVLESILVSDNLGRLLNPMDDTPKLIQGLRGLYVRLALKGGTFDSQAKALTLPRSGIAIKSQNIADGLTIMNLEIDVADDAPLGPVLLQVDNVEEVFETALTVFASNDVPALNLQPIWIAQGRRTAIIEVESTDFEIQKDITEFSFDDPAIHLLDVRTYDTDTHRAELTVELSPAARTDMSLLYVRSGDDLAAASFLVIGKDVPHVANVTPSVVARGEKRLITVHAPDIDFEEPATPPQIMSDIGVTVSVPRVDADDKHTLRFDMELEESGPGGSIGVLITSGSQNVVVLLRIDAGDSDDLTVELLPSSVSPGSTPTSVTVILPSQARFNIFSEVFTGIPNTYASSFEVTSTSKATFSLDVGYNVEAEVQGIPIFVATSSGVAVGFIALNEPPRYDVTSTAPWEGEVTMGETSVLELMPGSAPSLILSSLEYADLADLNLELLSNNGLDIAEESKPDYVWITDDTASEVLAVAYPLDDPEGMPARVEIKPLGERVTNHVEPPDRSTEAEWTLTSDPCENPFLGAGDIGGAFDLDRIAVDQTNCRLAVTAVARDLAQRPWETPDLWLSVWDASGEPIGGILSTGWPSSSYADPKLYLDDGLIDVQVAIGAQVGSAGNYLINIHRPYLIREFGRSPYVSYIEIEVDPSTSLDALSLELIDAQTGLTVEDLSFVGETAPEDGIILICIEELPEVDMVHPIAVLPDEGAFALRLLENGTLVDAVQVGWGSDSWGEGTPVPDEEYLPILSRALGIDTNDNSSDFVGGWIGTPGT